ncbi:MAG: hypothetical protein QJR12_01510 [Mycobacterium sp.]|uniref:hypothetical protein n=1 Tax=Mycobacterium sp. TaxID=1785 RepID=UPI002613E6E9|nr:hypothetical protein [Mycobacterium sp.]MDI3312988.1 hypothetical protein [Mycobacterium sp.]
MAADTPGRQLRVLAAGLHQLGDECEKIGGELAAAGAPMAVAAWPWQSNTGTINIAAAAAGKDVVAIRQRIATRGADYHAAGTAYTATDDDGAARFRGLVS